HLSARRRHGRLAGCAGIAVWIASPYDVRARHAVDLDALEGPPQRAVRMPTDAVGRPARAAEAISRLRCQLSGRADRTPYRAARPDASSPPKPASAIDRHVPGTIDRADQDALRAAE